MCTPLFRLFHLASVQSLQVFKISIKYILYTKKKGVFKLKYIIVICISTQYDLHNTLYRLYRKMYTGVLGTDVYDKD